APAAWWWSPTACSCPTRPSCTASCTPSPTASTSPTTPRTSATTWPRACARAGSRCARRGSLSSPRWWSRVGTSEGTPCVHGVPHCPSSSHPQELRNFSFREVESDEGHLVRGSEMEAKKAKAILLRHRYDDVEQLRRHLHVVDGATLIFYRDPKLNVTTGATVLIEIA